MKHWAITARGVAIAILLILSWKVLARGISPLPSGTILAVLDGANLIFHEAGHVLFSFFGEFLQILGGSLMQVIIPLTCTVYFWLHEQRSSSAVTLFWTGESITNVAIYVADARRMELPLIGGDHDWNYLLGRLGLLNQAEPLGRLVFFLGALTTLLAIIVLIADLTRQWNETKTRSVS